MRKLRPTEVQRPDPGGMRLQGWNWNPGVPTVSRSCPAWELDDTSPPPPAPWERKAGCPPRPRGPGSLPPLHPPPSPEQSTLAAGTFQPTDGQASAAATPPGLHPASAPQAKPPVPPPGPCSSCWCRHNCTGGILPLSSPSLGDLS
ncbi:hypothetical protein HJG60_007856 [Phyllostomus discolor]|uniref:Uncharacterized protein n=1 Tax=Phyllostomus discolor TaxID=89673 RepID=A0A834BL27_9CHIR|nr:hypothetical protein HJG60_007856 [Phyllostomus discolor]